MSDFGETVSVFLKTVSVFGETVSDFGETVSVFWRGRMKEAGWRLVKEA